MRPPSDLPVELVAAVGAGVGALLGGLMDVLLFDGAGYGSALLGGGLSGGVSAYLVSRWRRPPAS